MIAILQLDMGWDVEDYIHFLTLDGCGVNLLITHLLSGYR